MKAVVAIDLNEETSPAVLADAETFALKMGATLDVVFVDHVPAASYIHDPTVQSLFKAESDKRSSALRQRLTAMTSSLDTAIQGRARYRTAVHAATEIVDLGDHYDLIMIATHGRQGIGHLLMGSVAERVVRTSRVPTLVLRINKHS